MLKMFGNLSEKLENAENVEKCSNMSSYTSKRHSAPQKLELTLFTHNLAVHGFFLALSCEHAQKLCTCSLDYLCCLLTTVAGL